jgi:hypothetical protein
MRKILIFSLIVISFSCSDNAEYPGGGSTGQGGSMARFAIIGNNLYTVTNSNLNNFDISNPSVPVSKGSANIGFGIETIFPFGNNLFIGSQNGMFIYDVTNPSNPALVSNYSHFFSCDPVVSDGTYAYITLRNGSPCRGGMNRLEIVDVSNLNQPTLVSTFPMINPRGLGIANKQLFICDDGLKMYDVTDPKNIVLKEHLKIKAEDVIPVNGILLVIGDDGLYQYSHNSTSMTYLSKLDMSFYQ